MSNPVLKTCPKTSQNRFPGLPPLPPTRPEITSRIAFGRPSVELLSILVDFLHIPKLLKNRIPQNTAKNLKSRTPDHPNIDSLRSAHARRPICTLRIYTFLVLSLLAQQAPCECSHPGWGGPRDPKEGPQGGRGRRAGGRALRARTGGRARCARWGPSGPWAPWGPLIRNKSDAKRNR